MRTDNISVIREDGQASMFHMGFSQALVALRAGSIEEVFNAQGTFLGVRLLEPNQSQQSQSFHRASARNSAASLTQGDSEKNAEAVMESIERGEYVSNRSRRKVEAWPKVHDRQTVVIAAGKVHGATRVPAEVLSQL